MSLFNRRTAAEKLQQQPSLRWRRVRMVSSFFVFLVWALGFLIYGSAVTTFPTTPNNANTGRVETERKILQQDTMSSQYNKSMVMDPVYQQIGKSILVPVGCAAEGKYPFFIHQGGTNRWVCNNRGEKKVTAVMLKVFSALCGNPSSNGLMLDVGSNLGYYGLLAMRMGCESILFDLQPECQLSINNAIVVNQFTSLGRVMPFGVGNVETSFKVPSAGCNGRFPAVAHERNTFDQGNSMAHVYPLSKFIGDDQPIVMMKVDTEGNERNVLEGTMPYFSRRLVRHAIVEVTTGYHFWDHVNITQNQVAKTFEQIAKYGYTMISLHDYSVHDTPEDVYQYINSVTFPVLVKGDVARQSDVWLTTDAVNATDIEQMRDFISM